MAGRLGTEADIVISESVLGNLLEAMDSMLLDSPSAGVFIDGEAIDDEKGRFVHVKGMCQKDGIGICVATSEGGLEPTDEEVSLLKRNMPEGILMKVDVFAHQFSFYKISDSIQDETVLFSE